MDAEFFFKNICGNYYTLELGKKWFEVETNSLLLLLC